MLMIDCLMPTLPGREELRKRAIQSFVMQNLPDNWQVSLKTDPDPRPSLGAKLNTMVRRSVADIFVLLDDDDWHHPSRVAAQVIPLIEGAEISGTSQIYYFDAARNSAWLYAGNGDWLGGLAFTREAWERCPFEDFSSGVDYRWQKRSKSKKCDLALPSLFVAGLHARNTCPKNVFGPRWSPVALDALPVEFFQA
jgi:hypothetical protein